MFTGPEQPSVIYSDTEQCIALYGNVLLALSLQAPSLKCLESWTVGVDMLTERFGRPISVAIVIDSGARPPSDVIKREIQKITTRHRDSIGGFAYVLEGEGFGAAAVRSAVSLIALASRYPFPQRVFKRAGDAAIWLSDCTPANFQDGATVPGVVAAVDMMRRQVKPVAAAL